MMVMMTFCLISNDSHSKLKSPRRQTNCSNLPQLGLPRVISLGLDISQNKKISANKRGNLKHFCRVVKDEVGLLDRGLRRRSKEKKIQWKGTKNSRSDGDLGESEMENQK